jgi:hypothetical protein
VDQFVIFGTESRGLSVIDLVATDGRPPEQALVHVHVDGLSATHWIAEYPDFRGLVAYFAELERNWRGWRGTKNWVSLEGDLVLAATHTGSHVEVSVSLDTPSAWRAQADLSIGAGEELSAAHRTLAHLFTG